MFMDDPPPTTELLECSGIAQPYGNVIAFYDSTDSLQREIDSEVFVADHMSVADFDLERACICGEKRLEGFSVCISIGQLQRWNHVIGDRSLRRRIQRHQAINIFGAKGRLPTSAQGTDLVVGFRICRESRRAKQCHRCASGSRYE